MTERAEPMDAKLPSRSRRIVVICVYLLLLFIADAVIAAGSVSPGCIDGNFCSASERMISFAAAVMLLALAALIVALGWKGRLFGARKAS